MSGRLEAKVALITGAARGLGEAQARLFAAEGAHVVIADLLVPEGQALSAELGERGSFVHLDVTDEAAWARAIDAVQTKAGRLDVLVNNAGIALIKPLQMTTAEEYLDVVRVNQLGVFLGMKAVAPVMIEAGAGTIVNVSSVDGLSGTPYNIAYAASKFAVTGMTKTAAVELAKHGIRVNSIHPGGVQTDMRDEAAAAGVDIDALIASQIPLRRLARPDEIAHLSLFLASDDSSYCIGAGLVADGGVTAGIFTSIL